ncbi:MAG: hypothetical protein HY238_11505 [Acidobacteria bacterium]|nr:hypothetical protein [Acidobacteriota bacterium]
MLILLWLLLVAGPFAATSWMIATGEVVGVERLFLVFSTVVISGIFGYSLLAVTRH